RARRSSSPNPRGRGPARSPPPTDRGRRSRGRWPWTGRPARRFGLRTMTPDWHSGRVNGTVGLLRVLDAKPQDFDARLTPRGLHLAFLADGAPSSVGEH